MSGRRLFRYLAAVSAFACIACGDYTALTSPTQKVANKTSPVSAAFSRYILISGVTVCVEGCGSEAKNEGKNLLSVTDSLK
jgi:hypothetical protein